MLHETRLAHPCITPHSQACSTEYASLLARSFHASGSQISHMKCPGFIPSACSMQADVHSGPAPVISSSEIAVWTRTCAHDTHEQKASITSGVVPASLSGTICAYGLCHGENALKPCWSVTCTCERLGVAQGRQRTHGCKVAWAQRCKHVHTRRCLPAGANTLTAQVARILIRSLVEKSAYDRDHFLEMFIGVCLHAKCQCHVSVPRVGATCRCHVSVPRVGATCRCHVSVPRVSEEHVQVPSRGAGADTARPLQT
jgi:hypothetical protein